jgi:hypothetical protein
MGKALNKDNFSRFNYRKFMTKPSLLHVVKSVIFAAIGVQSNKNREIDFKQGSLPVYLIVGLIITLLFILAIASVASYVSSN